MAQKKGGLLNLSRYYNTTRRNLNIVWIPVLIFMAVAMVVYPKEVFQASIRGLDAWWNIVFPALLPFFVISELLMSLGVVRFLGILLEPVMRPLFNLPGAGAFVMAMGFTSGAPIGSMLTARLRKEHLCTRMEAERLMSFTNNASPLFMFGAISVGMFGDASLGMVIAGSHYLANFLLGLALRFYGIRDPEAGRNQRLPGHILRRAASALSQGHRENMKPAGLLLSNAIKNSVHTLTTIGGFIILFSVIIKVLELFGVLGFLGKIILIISAPAGIEQPLANALSSGFLEMTIGTKLASEAAVSLHHQVIATSMILGWAGLSVHAQVASMIADTDIRMTPFVLVRICHGFLAAALASLMMGPAQPVFNSVTGPLMHSLLPNLLLGPWLNVAAWLITLALIAFLVAYSSRGFWQTARRKRVIWIKLHR
ncbi:MAG: sporulation integral membrane protein YlbJ [Bacillota bacterium]